MIIPDANLLIHGFRPEIPGHEKALNWWQELLTGTESVGLHPLVESAFLRLMTKLLGPLPAAPMDQALDFCDGIRSNPVVMVVHEEIGPRVCFWSSTARQQHPRDRA